MITSHPVLCAYDAKLNFKKSSSCKGVLSITGTAQSYGIDSELLWQQFERLNTEQADKEGVPGAYTWLDKEESHRNRKEGGIWKFNTD